MVNLQDYGIEMWPDKKIAAFRQSLLTWYDANKRDLPWRRTSDPYAIWVSEIMLQQTRVDTVIPYYESFLYRLPTIQDLANAPEELLLKVWEGLGYYSRVRNMQIAAQQIVQEFNGNFPKNHEEILSLKGIGPYTAGAIASIAFGLAEPAVDGNVMRVLARLFEVNYDISDPKNRKIFQAIMEMLIDPERPGDFNQALMDLGSDIESPVNPRPEESPVKEFSAAYLHGTMDKYPIKLPKKKPKQVSLKGFVIRNEFNEFLLEKNTGQGLLTGFWTFPLMELAPDLQLVGLERKTQSLSIQQAFEQEYQLQINWKEQSFSKVQHVFSHRKWSIELVEGILENVISKGQLHREQKWVHPDDFHHYAFARPQQKMWQAYQEGSE